MSTPTSKHPWRTLLLLLTALLLLALIGAWALLAGSRARLDGTRQLHGLEKPITISRDALGTVTITGDKRTDISYALGYVHAQERFFEMDLTRRVAAGELAALVGPGALKVDLNHRRHRLRHVVETAMAQLPSAQRQQLDHYRDGVNAGLADLPSRPWEYLLLGTSPQPWRTEDSLLTVATMYLDLNTDGRSQRELRIAELRAALPDTLVDFLLAPDPNWEAPLRGQPSRSPVIPPASVFDLRPAGPARVTDLAAALAPALNASRPGSNSFAVAGTLTQSGAAMLANDMHLQLRVPNIWFRTRLRYPDPSAPAGQRDINGVSLPGTPAIIVGSNGQVAWGFTNSYGDWLDWIRVQRDPADHHRYKVPEGWAQIESYDEHIQVKGQADAILKVERTRWGPIMARDVDGTALALAWIGDQPRGYNLALLQLERATSAHQALDIAPHIGMPPQNLLVADHDGHIGWTIAGNSIPLRQGFDPQRPADWSTPDAGWRGWATPAQYPRIEDPADGRLWTANNRTVDGAALELLGNGGHDLGARAQQIRNRLRSRAEFTPGDLLDIQLDDRAVLLTRWQQLLQRTLANTQDPDLRELRRLTQGWRNRAAINSVDYRLVRAFRTRVSQATLAPFVARAQQHHANFAWPADSSAEAAVWALLQARPMHLLDPAYADWQALLTRAARDVSTELGQQPGGLAARTWGEFNRSDIRHPLSAALPAWLARWIDMPDQPMAGDGNMPRVAAPGFGASERLDVAPGHEADGVLNMPGGQSDHPLSPFHGAGHSDWVAGRPTSLLPGPTMHTLILQPAH